MATPKKKTTDAPKETAPKAKTATKTPVKAAAKPAAKPAAKAPAKTAAKAAAKPAAKAPAKPAAKPAAKAPAKAAAKPAAKPASKAPAKAAAKPAAKAPAKPAAKPAPKAPVKAATKPAAKAPAKPAPATPAKPAAKPAAKATAKPVAAAAPKADKKAPAKPAAPKAAKKKPAGDHLTAEEKARVKKLRETLALLKADPEWPQFLKEQREALLRLRDEMLPNMQDVTRDHLRSGASNVSSSSGQHIGDAGSEAEVRDLTIRLLDKDREQLFEIDAALERIRKGVYGICEISLDPIPKRRLQVRPFCRLTVKCQEEYEKKYGSYANYRAKKQDHVGYADLQNDMENAISLDESEE